MLTKNHDMLTAEVQAHIAADAVIQGNYWDGSKGCFIGCLAHSSNASVLCERFGLPLPLVRICENIFESLPYVAAKAFFAAIPSAVGRDGKDLTRVTWQFLAAELRALPDVPSDVQAVIDLVIRGTDLLASGKEWPEAYVARAAADDAATYAASRVYSPAAYAAARAARAASRAAAGAADAVAATRAAALAAALAAVGAADAAYAAALERQRDTILSLIAAA
jgi:hypothetical protein